MTTVFWIFAILLIFAEIALWTFNHWFDWWLDRAERREWQALGVPLDDDEKLD